jgi:hypothetical protein
MDSNNGPSSDLKCVVPHLEHLHPHAVVDYTSFH